MRGKLRGALKVLAILLLFAAFAFPLYWMITMSFKPQPEWNPTGQTIWWPQNPTWDNYKNVLGLTSQNTQFFQASSTDASQAIAHSLIAATGGTLIAMAVGVFAAFGIGRFRAGGRILPFQILQLRMFPPVAIIIPLLIMLAYLSLVNTFWGLWLVYAAVTFPFVVWLMRSFFQELPREIGEAAVVDGCTQWGAFFKAVLPNVKGGLAATALFVFILNWSDFLIALVISGDSTITAPVFLNGLQSAGAGQEYGPQAALGIILILPPAILGLAIQRYLVRGLTFGAIKR
jgi:multiple sugar transport system permease protein